MGPLNKYTYIDKARLAINTYLFWKYLWKISTDISLYNQQLYITTKTQLLSSTEICFDNIPYYIYKTVYKHPDES